ncbi:MAG: type I-E CRISPR-associated protein Cas6/Cse3/CasE [Acidiferrobacteraceae bacterium]
MRNQPIESHHVIQKGAGMAAQPQIPLREMVVRVPGDQSLRDWHRDAWRLAGSDAEKRTGRSFLFRVIEEEGVMLLRGPALPAARSTVFPTLLEGEERSFLLCVHAVSRLPEGERTIAWPLLREWLAPRMRGFVLHDLEGFHVTRFMERDDRGPIYGYDLSGSVQVVDAREAIATLASGIGRAKGFGFGMLVLL